MEKKRGRREADVRIVRELGGREGCRGKGWERKGTKEQGRDGGREGMTEGMREGNNE